MSDMTVEIEKRIVALLNEASMVDLMAADAIMYITTCISTLARMVKLIDTKTGEEIMKVLEEYKGVLENTLSNSPRGEDIIESRELQGTYRGKLYIRFKTGLISRVSDILIKNSILGEL